MELKFNPDYKRWKEEYETKPIYTKKEMSEALDRQGKELTVNRVVQSFTGRYGPNETRAMKILAIHKTPEGILVIVE